MKPIVKWSGGKRDELKEFKRYYPSTINTYVEPFFGGGSTFFDLNFKGNCVINDIHKELMNFYSQIKLGNAYKLYEILSSWKNQEKFYYYIRDEFLPKNNIELAAVFFYLRKTCYRGMLRYNKSGKFNIPYGRYKTYNIDILKDNRYYDILKDTTIENKGFENIMRNYDEVNNFFFIDPPYDSVFKDYGYCTFGPDEQNRLSECFKSMKAKVMIIIGKSELISSLYKEYIYTTYFKKYKFKIHSGRVGKSINNEHLIILNYKPIGEKLNLFFE